MVKVMEPILSGSLVTTAWRVLRLRMEEKAFWLGGLKEGDHWEDLGVDGMDQREIGFGNVGWIHWAQDRDRLRALVNTIMNLQVP
jgi:hypothetical protein